MIVNKYTLYFTLSVVALLTSALALSALVEHAQKVIITRTETGFEPAVVTIKKGQTVTFVASVSTPFWPASDSHPTHGKYPEFDPKVGLYPDESWSFTLEKAGVWKYHDHLKPEFTGKILVVGEKGESAENCLIDDADSIQAECWEADLTNIIKNKGVEAGFDAFREMYDESALFRRNCHDVTHYIGNIAYRLFQDTYETITRPETTYCGYGFYHGFIESALKDNGPSFYKEGRRYCESLGTHHAFGTDFDKHNAMRACFHGFGHAMFDSIEGAYWGDESAMTQIGIDACERTFDEKEARVSCSSGVYNSLAAALNAYTYNLSFDDNSPLNVCEQQKPEYQDECYIEVGIHYIRNRKWDTAATLAFIETLRPFDKTAPVISGYMSDGVRRTITAPDLPAIRDFCLSFAVETDRLACIEGATVGFHHGGPPGKEAKRVKSFCSLLPDDSNEKAQCLKQVIE